MLTTFRRLANVIIKSKSEDKKCLNTKKIIDNGMFRLKPA